MRRFYYDITALSDNTIATPLADLKINDSFTLPDSIVHHWCRVLRAKVGDVALLFDGFGGEYQAELIEVSKKNARAKLLAFDSIERTPNIMTTIGLVMSRGDRMDYAIQKATELGVSAIQLLTSQHGEVNLKSSQVPKKLLHWQQVAIAACEQCGLNRPPLIFAPLSVEDWLKPQTDKSVDLALQSQQVSPIVEPLLSQSYYGNLQLTASLRLVLAVPNTAEVNNQHLSASMIERIHQAFQAAQSSPCHFKLLIGPEGGLSNSELELAYSTGFEAWQIGKRVLRTETAPVAALATLYALCR